MALDMQNAEDVDTAVEGTLTHAFNTVTYKNGGFAGFMSTLSGLNLLATVAPPMPHQPPAIASFLIAVFAAAEAHSAAKDYLKKQKARRQQKKDLTV